MNSDTKNSGKEKGKILKYFEIEIEKPSEWSFEDYFIFVIETFYYIFFPFIIGILIGLSRKVWIIVLLLAPIFLKINKSTLNKIRQTKKIYFK